MEIKDRITLINLLVQKLVETGSYYSDNAAPGYNIGPSINKTAIRRQITTIREELLELSRQL